MNKSGKIGNPGSAPAFSPSSRGQLSGGELREAPLELVLSFEEAMQEPSERESSPDRPEAEAEENLQAGNKQREGSGNQGEILEETTEPADPALFRPWPAMPMHSIETPPGLKAPMPPTGAHEPLAGPVYPRGDEPLPPKPAQPHGSGLPLVTPKGIQPPLLDPAGPRDIPPSPKEPGPQPLAGPTNLRGFKQPPLEPAQPRELRPDPEKPVDPRGLRPPLSDPAGPRDVPPSPKEPAPQPLAGPAILRGFEQPPLEPAQPRELRSDPEKPADPRGPRPPLPDPAGPWDIPPSPEEPAPQPLTGPTILRGFEQPPLEPAQPRELRPDPEKPADPRGSRPPLSDPAGPRDIPPSPEEPAPQPLTGPTILRAFEPPPLEPAQPRELRPDPEKPVDPRGLRPPLSDPAGPRDIPPSPEQPAPRPLTGPALSPGHETPLTEPIQPRDVRPVPAEPVTPGKSQPPLLSPARPEPHGPSPEVQGRAQKPQDVWPAPKQPAVEAPRAHFMPAADPGFERQRQTGVVTAPSREKDGERVENDRPLPSFFSGDAILQSLHRTEAQPVEAPPQETRDASSLATALTEQILVSAADDPRQEVHIRLKDSVLLDTDIIVARDGEHLRISLVTGNASSHQTLVNAQYELRDTLHSLGESVTVEVSLKGGEGDADSSDRQSRGREYVDDQVS